MQGRLESVKLVLAPSNAFVIPPYQRQYSWTEERWQALVSDVIGATTAKSSDPDHWLGILLLSNTDEIRFPGDEDLNTFDVIDGQQRIVTITIWQAALIHHAYDCGIPIDVKITQLPRLHVQVADKVALDVALNNQWRDPKYDSLAESQILKAYRYFRWILWLGSDAILEEHPIKLPKWVSPTNDSFPPEHWSRYLDSKRGIDLPRGRAVNVQELLSTTRNKLKFYALVHESNIDEPQAVIFDTLNGMRTELEPLEHVRNSIFVRMDNTTAQEVFNQFWAPAEETMRQVSMKGTQPGISFLYDFAISKGEKKRQGTISRSKGASHFSRMTKGLENQELAKYITDEVVPAMAAWPVVVASKKSASLNGIVTNIPSRTLELLSSIREMSKNPANPLVLLYLSGFLQAKLSEAQLNNQLFKIEAAIARQILSLTPLSPLRARIMDVMGFIDSRIDDLTLTEAIKKFLWVENSVVLSGSEKNQYGSELTPSQLGSVFRGIERKLSGSGAMNFKIGAGEYTIEHIYPRKDGRWQNDLDSWNTSSKKMSAYLETLGNLTVVTSAHNSSVGNKTFKDKKDFKDKPGTAPLRLHDTWAKETEWTEKEIAKRSDYLLTSALDYWKI